MKGSLAMPSISSINFLFYDMASVCRAAGSKEGGMILRI